MIGRLSVCRLVVQCLAVVGGPLLLRPAYGRPSVCAHGHGRVAVGALICAQQANLWPITVLGRNYQPDCRATRVFHAEGAELGCGGVGSGMARLNGVGKRAGRGIFADSSAVGQLGCMSGCCTDDRRVLGSRATVGFLLKAWRFPGGWITLIGSGERTADAACYTGCA
jgi:hypothetical protein